MNLKSFLLLKFERKLIIRNIVPTLCTIHHLHLKSPKTQYRGLKHGALLQTCTVSIFNFQTSPTPTHPWGAWVGGVSTHVVLFMRTACRNKKKPEELIKCPPPPPPTIGVLLVSLNVFRLLKSAVIFYLFKIYLNGKVKGIYT